MPELEERESSLLGRMRVVAESNKSVSAVFEMNVSRHIKPNKPRSIPTKAQTMRLYRKKLSDPSMFPIKIQISEVEWKVALSYYVPADKFALTVNDIPFHGMPFQAEVNPEGPQNIDNGLIKLNDVQVHTGFGQYEPETFQSYVVSEGLQLTTDIFIGQDDKGNGFK